MTDDRRKLAATYAFLTYIGETLASPQPAIGEHQAAIIREGMKALGLAPDWELVWGPMAYRFPMTLTHLYDNLMFVARRDNEYIIAVRGTNGRAKLDWVFEDFWVGSETPWSKVAEVEIPAGLDAKISAATHLGLNKLLSTPIRGHVPGSGTHLVDFLHRELHQRPPASVLVTGHSLAGALAPTLTLYLADTQGRANGWDPGGQTALSCVAFAGPTAGNKDFAAYLEQRIGATTQRVVNPLDIVPMAWGAESLAAAPDIYSHIDHPVDAPLLVQLGVPILVDHVRDLDYRHYHESGPGLVTLDEIRDHQADSFKAQAFWQHVDGYENQLGIPGLRQRMRKVFESWCAANPGVCPS